MQSRTRRRRGSLALQPAGRSSSSPSRDAGAHCWRPGAALCGRRGGSSSPARAAAGRRRAADLGAAWGSRRQRRLREADCAALEGSGLGSRSREKETVQTRDWAAGPYRLGRDVSILKFPVHITWDTRTRRGYVSRPYPRCIRIGYVSDTGYGTAVTYPCF